LHLVGDVHQPLHVGALFTENRFPDGDQGGNKIFVVGPSKNLHKAWDESLGHAEFLPLLTSTARRIMTTPALRREALQELSTTSTFSAWMRESLELARAFAYDGDIRDAIRAAENDDGPMPRIQLSSEYIADVRDVAQKQVALAGYRLADVLRRQTDPADHPAEPAARIEK